MIIKKGISISKNIKILIISSNRINTHNCSIVAQRTPSIATFLSDEYVSDYLL